MMKQYMRTMVLAVLGLTWWTVANAAERIQIVASNGRVTQVVKDNQCTLTVKPDADYFIRISDIVVEKTIEPGQANSRTRSESPDISNHLTLTGGDPEDLGAERSYTFTMPDDEYGVKVTATFLACTEITKEMVTLADTTFVYDGEVKAIGVTIGNLKEGRDYTLTYANHTNAGRATVTVTGHSAYKGSLDIEYPIKKAEIKVIALPKALELSYTGSAQKLIKVGAVDGGVLTYSTNNADFSKAIPLATDAGSYKVWYTATGDDNHENTDTTLLNVTIKKVLAEIDTYPVAKALTANSSAQALITAGTAIGGELQYSLDDNEYSTNIPTGMEAGTYTIYYKVVAKSGYEDVDPQSFKVSIAKKEVTVTAKDATKVKGSDDPELTYDVVGLVGSDKLTGALSRQAGEDIGVYAITQGTLKASDNYTLTFVGAKLTIYLKGDANGDNKVNVADIVEMVKAGKPQTDIDEVVKIIMGSNE